MRGGLGSFEIPILTCVNPLQIGTNQRADERTRTADLLITSALLHVLRNTALSGKDA